MADPPDKDFDPDPTRSFGSSRPTARFNATPVSRASPTHITNGEGVGLTPGDPVEFQVAKTTQSSALLRQRLVAKPGA